MCLQRYNFEQEKYTFNYSGWKMIEDWQAKIQLDEESPWKDSISMALWDDERKSLVMNDHYNFKNISQ